MEVFLGYFKTEHHRVAELEGIMDHLVQPLIHLSTVQSYVQRNPLLVLLAWGRVCDLDKLLTSLSLGVFNCKMEVLLFISFCDNDMFCIKC